jgi:hypothetical protein
LRIALMKASHRAVGSRSGNGSDVVTSIACH